MFEEVGGQIGQQGSSLLWWSTKLAKYIPVPHDLIAKSSFNGGESIQDEMGDEQTPPITLAPIIVKEYKPLQCDSTFAPIIAYFCNKTVKWSMKGSIDKRDFTF